MSGISTFCCTSCSRSSCKTETAAGRGSSRGRRKTFLCSSLFFFFITCTARMKSDGEAAGLLTCCHDDSFHIDSRAPPPPPLRPRPCQSAPGLRLIGRWRQTGRQTSRRAAAQEFSQREAAFNATPAPSEGEGPGGVGVGAPPFSASYKLSVQRSSSGTDEGGLKVSHELLIWKHMAASARLDQTPPAVHPSVRPSATTTAALPLEAEIGNPTRRTECFSVLWDIFHLFVHGSNGEEGRKKKNRHVCPAHQHEVGTLTRSGDK